MSDIFISYEKSDLHCAEMLAHSLRACGWSAFWDRTIPAGSAWRKTIGRELDNARCVVVLWSKTSLDSDWVHEEADDARRRGILVPVLIEDIQAPIGFRTIQAANLVNWDGTESTTAFRRLITDISAKIGPPPNLEKVEENKRSATIIEHEAESKRIGSEAQTEPKIPSKTDEKTEARQPSKKEDKKENRTLKMIGMQTIPNIMIILAVVAIAGAAAVWSLSPRVAPNAESPVTSKPDKPQYDAELSPRVALNTEPPVTSKLRSDNSQYLVFVYYQGPQRAREAQAVGDALAAKGFRYHVENTDLRSTKLGRSPGSTFIQATDKGDVVLDEVVTTVRKTLSPPNLEVANTLPRSMNGDVQVQLW